MNVVAANVTIWSGSFTIAKYGPKPLYQGPKSWAAEAKLAGKIGNKLGAVGLGITVIDIGVNGLSTSNTLDATFGTIAFLGPVGAGIAGAYFVGNLLTIGITGQSIGEHLQGAVTGDAKASWKPWGN